MSYEGSTLCYCVINAFSLPGGGRFILSGKPMMNPKVKPSPPVLPTINTILVIGSLLLKFAPDLFPGSGHRIDGRLKHWIIVDNRVASTHLTKQLSPH